MPTSFRPWDLLQDGGSVAKPKFWSLAFVLGKSLISLNLGFLIDKMEMVKLALQGWVR